MEVFIFTFEFIYSVNVSISNIRHHFQLKAAPADIVTFSETKNELNLFTFSVTLVASTFPANVWIEDVLSGTSIVLLLASSSISRSVLSDSSSILPVVTVVNKTQHLTLLVPIVPLLHSKRTLVMSSLYSLYSPSVGAVSTQLTLLPLTDLLLFNYTAGSTPGFYNVSLLNSMSGKETILFTLRVTEPCDVGLYYNYTNASCFPCPIGIDRFHVYV